MSIKPKLQHKPSDYAYKSLKAKYAQGTPLSGDQLNFLAWHEKLFSNPHMDPVLQYYLKHYKTPYLTENAFLLPHEIMNKQDIEKLKKRLIIMLQEKNKNVQLKMTSEQFLEFKKITYHELMLYHGNQFLTGAPFYYGGLPHIIYFQWGNLFGVAKYVILAEEKALKSNVLVYFEDMMERDLNECVHEYNHKHLSDPKPAPTQTQTPQPTQETEYKIPTPTLSLSRNNENNKKD